MDDDRENNADSEAKRRKIRKGTRSCWECKRRKMKCIFAGAPTDAEAICIGCQRRGTKCISQEFELVEGQAHSTPLEKKRRRQTGSQDRVARVEALVENLIKKVGSDGTPVDGGTPTTSDDGGNPTPSHGMPTPVSIDSDSARLLSLCKPSDDHGSVDSERKYEKLSQDLHDSLPSREDLEKICKARGNRSTLSHEMLVTPYTVLEQSGLKLPESLLEIPGPDLHPVLIARYMLYVASFLQHLHPNLLKGINGLSESPCTIMKRLIGIVTSLVTINDELLSSIEGLECIMIESLYQANGGNLRRSWIINRKAMVIAQLMNLHRSSGRAQYKVLDPKTRANPKLMWFRIVFHDRHLCLMLGLTQGSLDQSIATDAMFRNDTLMGRLERMHCALASRILERNESDPSSDDFTLTQDLDIELQKAARSMPSKWWLTPNLASVADDPQALFWDMGRLFNQLFHYNLLNQLHLPYMICCSSPERKYEYSRITCVNASREVLSRFIMFRSFNRNAFCCRTVDFFALMAAITLLLAHLDSHRSSQTGNLLAHQYLSDRAMIEQAQENMEEISRLNGDTLSAQSADLLRRLLAIEAETADGLSTESVSVQTPSEMLQPDEDSNAVLRVQIPYFGIVRIARQGVISKEMASPQTPAINGQTQAPAIDSHPESMAETGYDSVDGIDALTTHFGPQFPDSSSHSLPPQYEYPLLTAGVDDWAFQGVDMAFFGSLMKGAGDDEYSDEISGEIWTREDHRIDNGY